MLRPRHTAFAAGGGAAARHKSDGKNFKQGDTAQKRNDSAHHLFKGMMGPKGQTDVLASKASPINGRATARATKATMERSTVFESWYSTAPQDGWAMSKLGCATTKMPININESQDALQLQVIKGLNVFEFDGGMGPKHQNISNTLNEVFGAFELDREGCVFMMRVGKLRQPLNFDEMSRFEVNNVAPIRNRMDPVIERYNASSLPQTNLRQGFNIRGMTDEQLLDLNLRRHGPFWRRSHAAALTPKWIEASLTNCSYHMQIETIDVLLIEALEALYDGRPESDVEKDILELFKYLEQLVADGTIQTYGISSAALAPPLPRAWPPLPADKNMMPIFMKPEYPDHLTPVTLNLHKLLAIAKQAHGGDGHHLRHVSYPFNLTQHQAKSTKLPYDARHTLQTLCKELGLSTFGFSPIETLDMSDQVQRYHRFPLPAADLESLRSNMTTILEKCVQKEREIKPYLDKMTNPPEPEAIYVASRWASQQRWLLNYYFFMEYVENDVVPRLRQALTRVREGSVRDVKDWATAFDTAITDLLQVRRQIFEERCAKNIYSIDAAIDRAAPTLRRCPIVSQKALTFATHGADVTLGGFHESRYFHEATHMNPLAGVNESIPAAEIEALFNEPEVSYTNVNPPHPYQLARIGQTGQFSKQKMAGDQYNITIDPKNPKYPDIDPKLSKPKGPVKMEAPPAPSTLKAQDPNPWLHDNARFSPNNRENTSV
jgi:hypothetical protein